MTSKPFSYETLLAYAEGLLGPEEAHDVEAHLQTDSRAAAIVARYRTALEAVRTDDSQAAPASMIARAKAIFDPAMLPKRPTLLERIDDIIARLIFDSRVQPSLAGLRGRGDGFHAAYEIQGAQIDLQIERVEAVEPASGSGAGQWRVVGQLMAEQALPAFEIELVNANTSQTAAKAASDERGMFTLASGSGCFDVILHQGSRRIVLPRLEIP